MTGENADASPRSDPQVSHAEFLACRRFESLDGLRALSILAVIWHHTAATAFGGGLLAHMGTEGVTLFFAISGFLITTLLLRERHRTGLIDLRAFYVRRALRIFPLYYVVLMVYLVLVVVLERNSAVGGQFFRNLPYFLTYTSNWFVPLDGRVIFYFAWSLAAEEQFYLVWPALMNRLKTGARALVVIAAVTAVLIGIESLPVSDPFPGPDVRWFVTKVPLAIMLGVMAGLALDSPRGFSFLRPCVGSRSASVLWMLAVAAFGFLGAPRFVLHSAMVGLVISCVVNPRHCVAFALNWPPLAYVGKISYGMYLVHMLCKNLSVRILTKLSPEPGWSLIFLTTTVLAVVAAGLSFRFFESSFLSRKVAFER